MDFQRYFDKHPKDVSAIIATAFNSIYEMDDWFMNDYFMVTNYDDFDQLWLNVDTYRPAANIIACDGSIVNRKKGVGPINEITQRDFKLAAQCIFKEKDFRSLYNAMRNSRGLPAPFIEYLYGRLASLTPMIMRSAKAAAWSVLRTGKADMKDPLTGITAQQDYSCYLVDGCNIPSKLTGTKKWDQYATANGFGDLQAHIEKMYDLLYRYPDAVVMRKSLMDHLIRQESTKRSMMLFQLGVQCPCEADLAAYHTCIDKVMDHRRDFLGCLPEIFIYDDYYDEEQKDCDEYNRVHYVPEDSYILLYRNASGDLDIPGLSQPGGMGELAFLPTVESGSQGPRNGLGQYTSRMSSGIYTWAEELSVSPPRDRFAAVANAVVKLYNPKAIASRKVL